MAKFASLIRAAKFKGAVHGSVKFQRTKSRSDFACPFASRAVKFKKERVAAAVIEFLQFANRAVKFQAIALCFKTRCAPQRRGRQTKHAQSASKFVAMGEISAKFKQTFDAAHKISQREGLTPIKI